MMTGRELFDGRRDLQQFAEMCRAMENPTSQEWPEMKLLPNAELFLVGLPLRRHLGEFLENSIPNSAWVELILKLLKWNPQHRLSANETLNEPLFSGIAAWEAKHQCLPKLVLNQAHQRKKEQRQLSDLLVDGIDFSLDEPLPDPCTS
jgi:serine/threonine protein kinase